MNRINVLTRFCAETRRLLTAVNNMRSQEELGKGAAYAVYMAQARKSASILIAKGC